MAVGKMACRRDFGYGRGMSAAPPLADLLVVALEQAVAAPTCTARLARAGARVIKIERPEGDFARGYDRFAGGVASYFAWLNQGKESIVLDLKQPDDAAVLARMLARADVFVQNLLPGAAARLGFASAALRRRHPRLIAVDIGGYGQPGPYADRKAYDLLIQAESGLASVTGRPEGPGRVGVSICDVMTGLEAYQGVLEALLARARDGLGRSVKVSLFDTMAELMTVPFLQRASGAPAPARLGLAHPSIAPYGAFPTRDGEILIAVQNEREWQRLARDVLGLPQLLEDRRFADNPARVANRPALEMALAARTAVFTRSDLAARLAAAGIAFAAVSTLDDLLVHPQLRKVTVPLPSGGFATLPAPALRGEGEAAPPAAVPALDEHGAALRQEFGV